MRSFAYCWFHFFSQDETMLMHVFNTDKKFLIHHSNISAESMWGHKKVSFLRGSDECLNREFSPPASCNDVLITKIALNTADAHLMSGKQIVLNINISINYFHQLLILRCYWAIPEIIQTIPRRLFGIPKARGGGSFNWKSEGIGGYLRLKFRRQGGGFRSGISTGDRQECIP